MTTMCRPEKHSPGVLAVALLVWFASVRISLSTLADPTPVTTTNEQKIEKKPATGPALPMDRDIRIRPAQDAARRREALISYLWGSDGFPAQRLPDIVLTNVSSPGSNLTQLARVDELRMDLAPGLQGLAYHFIPERPNSDLVVVHHGHACTLDDDPSPKDVGYGLQRTINALLHEGYGVLGVFMPHMRPGDCTGGHDKMFELQTM